MKLLLLSALQGLIPSHCLHRILQASLVMGGSEHRKVAAACLYLVKRIRAKAFFRRMFLPFSDARSCARRERSCLPGGGGVNSKEKDIRRRSRQTEGQEMGHGSDRVRSV
jgi:hypothetical protein